MAMIVDIAPDPSMLAQRAATFMVDVLAGIPGPVSVCLSGGSTPKRLFERLTKPPFARLMPWDRVHWFWGDERFVPPDDLRSNFRMTAEAMLRPMAVPESHIHAVPTTGLSAEQAALQYQTELQAFYGAETLMPDKPLFDVTLLGLGTNGHTASLFPDEAVLAERQAWAAPTTPPGEPTRITLTYPVLDSSRHAAFLVSGADKAPMFARLRNGDPTIPAGRIRPVGQLLAFADAAAASGAT